MHTIVRGKLKLYLQKQAPTGHGLLACLLALEPPRTLKNAAATLLNQDDGGKLDDVPGAAGQALHRRSLHRGLHHLGRGVRHQYQELGPGRGLGHRQGRRHGRPLRRDAGRDQSRPPVLHLRPVLCAGGNAWLWPPRDKGQASAGVSQGDARRQGEEDRNTPRLKCVYRSIDRTAL